MEEAVGIEEVMAIKGNRRKILIKLMIVALIIGVLIYTGRKQMKPIMMQLMETSPWIILTISVCALLYNLVEGWVLCSMMRLAQPGFRLSQGIFASLYSAFYRVATMGSGSGIAVLVYLNRSGIAYSKASGYYAIHYMLHKLTTVLYAAVAFLVNYKLINKVYSKSLHLILIGCLLALLICVAITAVCCWSRLHRWLIKLAKRLDLHGSHEANIQKTEQYFYTLESACAEILTKPRLVGSILLRNFVKCTTWYVIPFILFAHISEIGLVETVGLMAVSVVLASVVPAPAGIGSTEVVFMMFFATIVGQGAAGSAALLYRFATFLVPFLAGAVASGISRLLYKNN